MTRAAFTLILVSLTFTVASLRCQSWEEPTEELQKLTASDGAAEDDFGNSVAIHGGVAVIGAPKDDNDNQQSGSAHVFRYDLDEGDWVEEQKLTSPDDGYRDFFGSSIAVSGDVIVVGTPGCRSAFVFRYDQDEDEWMEEQELSAPEVVWGEAFGFTVATVMNVIVVGAPSGTSSGTPGSAYVFRYDSDEEEWSEGQRLVSSDGVPGDQFGKSVAMFGELVLVGASGDDDNGLSSGSAYVFRYDSDDDGWLEEQKLTDSDGAALDAFGCSAALCDDIAVVGAFGDDVFTGSAIVYRYDPDEEEWAEEQKLTASDASEIDVFGWSLACSEGAIVIGAHGSSSAYLFRYHEDEAEWTENQKLDALGGTPLDSLGYSVSIFDDLVICGATTDDDNGAFAGAAHLFLIDSLLRGDVDGNGTVSAIADSYRLMCWGFLDCDAPLCLDSADVDDNGEVEPLVDALYLLEWAFSLGAAPPDPGPDSCGSDPTGDDVGCEVVAEGFCL